MLMICLKAHNYTRHWHHTDLQSQLEKTKTCSLHPWMCWQPKWMTKCLWRILQQDKYTAQWWPTTACNEYGTMLVLLQNKQHRRHISHGCHHHQVQFWRAELRRQHHTVFWGACDLSSCNTCSARKGGPQGTEMGPKKQTIKQPWSEHANGDTLVTLIQAGGDTTTWSVCTCWPEAVTTGASVCSCTAVTVPCACR